MEPDFLGSTKDRLPNLELDESFGNGTLGMDEKVEVANGGSAFSSVVGSGTGSLVEGLNAPLVANVKFKIRDIEDLMIASCDGCPVERAGSV